MFWEKRVVVKLQAKEGLGLCWSPSPVLIQRSDPPAVSLCQLPEIPLVSVSSLDWGYFWMSRPRCQRLSGAQG